ncbi:hypothetical protein TSUD_354170 [Trifolium subterraneum]|uniref:F-box domain-containing protein n=1 Tax=Trifolium subterraneum TaxID=3900 RepID=A0A2Z6MRG0_TRISU|nr:hypothetical protein TSUD_354170 [Trifolium subterraneum]
MSVFSKLDEDVITFHILPHLDGKTLIILSSVSSQFHNLIWKNINNNSDLWLNICISTWPSLLTTLPGGYRSFFLDAFPSIHPPLNNPLPPPLPRNASFFYTVDIFLRGEQQPLCSLHNIQLLIDTYHPCIFEVLLIHTKEKKNFIKRPEWNKACWELVYLWMSSCFCGTGDHRGYGGVRVSAACASGAINFLYGDDKVLG